MLVLFSHSFPFSIRKNNNRRKILQIVFENKKRKKKQLSKRPARWFLISQRTIDHCPLVMTPDASIRLQIDAE